MSYTEAMFGVKVMLKSPIAGWHNGKVNAYPQGGLDDKLSEEVPIPVPTTSNNDQSASPSKGR